MSLRAKTLSALVALGVPAGCQAGLPGPAGDGGAAEVSSDATRESDEDPARWERAAPVQEAIAAARSHYGRSLASSGRELELDVRVLDTATGAFTRPQVEQRAVLYRIGKWPRGFPPMGIALLEGERLVANFAHTIGADQVGALRDFDGSGRDALALEGGFGMGGQYTRAITIAAFADGGLVSLGNVETYNDACGMGREEFDGRTRGRISRTPGAGWVVERERAATCESETWEPVGSPEPLVLEPDERRSFTRIP